MIQNLTKYVTDTVLQCMYVSSKQHDESAEQASSDHANSLISISQKELQKLRSLVASMKKQKVKTGTRA